MNQEWQKMMDSADKMEEMMKDMDMTGMEEAGMEWQKMRESMKKLDEIMTKKQGGQ